MARFTRSDPASSATPGGSYWTDGWDGYAPARKRLLGMVAERKLPNVVVLGGDVHSHYVTDLKVDYDDAKSAVIASEFCGSSISSHGISQQRIDAALPFNPHVHYARGDQRGYMDFTLTGKRLDASLLAVVEPNNPA
jgi:alkaline phosphatase D